MSIRSKVSIPVSVAQLPASFIISARSMPTCISTRLASAGHSALLRARRCGKAEMAGNASKPCGRGCRRRCDSCKSFAWLPAAKCAEARMVGSSSNQQSLSLVDKGPIHYAILEAQMANITGVSLFDCRYSAERLFSVPLRPLDFNLYRTQSCRRSIQHRLLEPFGVSQCHCLKSQIGHVTFY